MLRLVEGITEKRTAQAVMKTMVTAAVKRQGVRNIGFPSGNRDETIYSNGTGKLWCAFGLIEDAPIPRRWNAFGVYDEKRPAQLITVEINIATEGNSARVAGFFATNLDTGRTYLMHDGGVGGGKIGVGRFEFLAWSKSSTLDVAGSGGKVRTGIMIGDVADSALPSRLWRFVQLVRRFKDAVASGELRTPDFERMLEEYERYSKEFSGQKTGSRGSRLDYFSYHGDVVDKLREEREAEKTEGEQVLNSLLVDLYVRNGTTLTEVYEVKSSVDRQVLYSALGQLLIHSLEAGSQPKKILVVPHGDIPSDIASAFVANNVVVRRFELSGGRTKVVTLGRG